MLKKLLLIVTVVLGTSVANAQNNVAEEEKAVSEAVLNYIENFFENKFDEMNASLHPRLAKRGLNPDGTMYEDLPPAKLKEMMSKKKPLALEHQKNLVDQISVFGKMASASLTTGYPNMKWKEYVHLVKDNGQWKIINIFWEYYPMKKRSKKK